MTFPLTDPKTAALPADGRDYAFLVDLAAALGFGVAATMLAIMQSGPVEAMTVIGFICAGLLIWWAWLAQVWFDAVAGGHDPRPGPLAWLSDLAVITGGVLLAIGIPGLTTGLHVELALAGYAVMRLALAARWILGARMSGARGAEAAARARSIVIALIYWLALAVLVPGDAPLFVPLFLFGAACEIALTFQAARHGALRADAAAIIRRHGRMVQLLLGIVLFQTAIGQMIGHGVTADPARAIWPVLVAAVITISLWTIYAATGQRPSGTGMARLHGWYAGHGALFLALAAVSGGAFGPSLSGEPNSGAAILAIGGACALLAIWAIGPAFDRDEARRRPGWYLPACAAAIIGGIWLTPVPAETATLILLLASWLAWSRRR